MPSTKSTTTLSLPGQLARSSPSRRCLRIPIPLPPLAEQWRIVAAIDEELSRLEAATASLRAASARTDTMVAAATAQALAGDWPLVQLLDVTLRQEYGTSAKAG